MTNFLPACKNIGVTHITNGAYRLHPVEWNVGEVAGSLALHAFENGVTPRDIATDETQLRAFQRAILAVGVPLYWWDDITFDDPDLFRAAHLLGVNEIMTGGGGLHFDPHAILTDDAKTDIAGAVSEPLDWPSGDLTRGQAALWLQRTLGL